MNGVFKERISHARDYTFEAVVGPIDTEAVFPTVYEIPRENTGTLKDQGDVGACVAEVICQVAERLWSEALDEDNLEMSEGFSYATLRDGHNGSGLFISQAMKLWCSVGTLPKKYFDKLQEMPEIREIVDSVPEFYEVAKKYAISGYVAIDYADKKKKDAAIKTALLKHCDGLIAVSHDFFPGGSHCIMLCGWNDERDTYIFKNSWGKDYGDDGFAEIPKGEVDRVYMAVLSELELPFTDVPKTAWHYKYIKNMYFAGLMKGTSDTTFEPDRPITRAEAAVVEYNIVKAMDERFDILNKVMEGEK